MKVNQLELGHLYYRYKIRTYVSRVLIWNGVTHDRSYIYRWDHYMREMSRMHQEANAQHESTCMAQKEGVISGIRRRDAENLIALIQERLNSTWKT